MNAYWAGKHWSKRKDDARFWHSMVQAELYQMHVSKEPTRKPVRISFWWNDGLDLNNHSAISKMVIDSMVNWVIEDDSRPYHVEEHHYWHDQDYILVEVDEI